MTTTVHKVEKPSDLDDLRKLMDKIIGEPCWKASISYGEILVVDFGKRFSHILPSRRGEYISEWGNWYIRCLISTWKIVSPTETLITSEHSREETRKAIKALQDSFVTSLDPQYPDLGLIITFSNGNMLIVTPGLEDDEENLADNIPENVQHQLEEIELPYWELHNQHFHINAGPSNVWVHTQYNDEQVEE